MLSDEELITARSRQIGVMNATVIHPGDKVTITLSLDDGKDLPSKKEKMFQRSKSSPEQTNVKEQEKDKKKNPERPPLISRRTSSLLSLNIEGLLIVPEYEKRLRRKSYSGASGHDNNNNDAPKETDVDPSDGMLTTSLCTTEL